MTRLLSLAFLLICVTACNKKTGEPSLIGKWIQTEYYDMRPTVGCNCWIKTSETAGVVFEFKKDGTYSQRPPLYSSVMMCGGTYAVVGDSLLSLTSACWGTATPTQQYSYTFEGKILIVDINYPNPSFNTRMKFKKQRGY